MRIITLADVEYGAFRLAQEALAYDEPIPDFSTRFPHRLESCVVIPFQKIGGKYLYPTLVDKAAILFYLMIKNHPFQNGNKRIALSTLLTFLFLNGRWIKADVQELYNFTMWIAMSPAEFKDQSVAAITQFIQDHLVEL